MTGSIIYSSVRLGDRKFVVTDTPDAVPGATDRDVILSFEDAETVLQMLPHQIEAVNRILESRKKAKP